MSISSALVAAQQKVANAYTAISGKGGTLPVTQNLSNMPDAINSIPAGGGTGVTKEIVSGVLSNKATTWNLQGGPTSVQTYALYYAQYNNTDLTGVTGFNTITSVGIYGMAYCFYGNSSLTSYDFSNLAAIEERGMFHCFDGAGITSATFPNRTDIGQYGLAYGFVNSKVRNVKFGTVGADNYALAYSFRDSQYIDSFEVNYFVTPSGIPYSSGYMRYCLAYAFQNSTIRKFFAKNYSNYLHNFFYYAFDGSQIKFFGSNFDTHRNSAQNTTWQYAFRNCQNLKAITLCGGGGLKQATSCFQNDSNLIHAYMQNAHPSGANNAGSNMFNGCTKLKKAEFYPMYAFGGSYYGLYKNCFVGNLGITFTAHDTAFTCPNATASNSQFYGCDGVAIFNFPEIRSQSGTAPTNIFTGASGVQEIHFNTRNKTAIEALSGYSTLWGLGAGAANVYFDLIVMIKVSGESNIIQYRAGSGQHSKLYGFIETADSIVFNGVTYYRHKSSDKDMFFAFKNGDDYVYTLTPNPCSEEPVYNADEEEIGIVTSSDIYFMFNTTDTSANHMSYFTKNGLKTAVGDNVYYLDSEWRLVLGGTVTLAE